MKSWIKSKNFLITRTQENSQRLNLLIRVYCLQKLGEHCVNYDAKVAKGQTVLGAKYANVFSISRGFWLAWEC